MHPKVCRGGGQEALETICDRTMVTRRSNGYEGGELPIQAFHMPIPALRCVSGALGADLDRDRTKIGSEVGTPPVFRGPLPFYVGVFALMVVKGKCLLMP